jgi:N-methylhydantoinase A
VPVEAITFRYAIDARYHGQGNEITITLGEGPSWPATPETVAAAFAERYAAVYGMTIPGVPVEVVTWRLSAFAPAPEVAVALASDARARQRRKGTRSVRFTRGEAPVDTAVVDRGALVPGDRVEGPALVEERETTAVLRPGWSAVVNEDGSLVATRRGGGS